MKPTLRTSADSINNAMQSFHPYVWQQADAIGEALGDWAEIGVAVPTPKQQEAFAIAFRNFMVGLALSPVSKDELRDIVLLGIFHGSLSEREDQYGPSVEKFFSEKSDREFWPYVQALRKDHKVKDFIVAATAGATKATAKLYHAHIPEGLATAAGHGLYKFIYREASFGVDFSDPQEMSIYTSLPLFLKIDDLKGGSDQSPVPYRSNSHAIVRYTDLAERLTGSRTPK